MNRPATQLVLSSLLFLMISSPLLGGQVASEVDDLANGGKEPPMEIDQAVRGARLELALGAALAEQARGNRQGSWSGFGLGVGLVAFTDQQGGLLNTFSQSTVTLRDPFGGESTTVLDGDPKLNNRKFDFELDLKGGGVFIPITLPSFGGTSSHSLTLGLEITEADVTFDTFDQTAGSALSSSFSGSGPMYGVEFETRVCLSALCRSIWSTSYGYRVLPRLGVDRGILPEGPRFEIFEDEASIRREAHEISTRISYTLGTSDRFYAPYAGVLYRDAEVEIRDHIRFIDGLEIETAQDTTTRFECGNLLAVAGFEAQLSKSIFGSFESFFGDEDYGLRFQVAWSNKPALPPAPDFEEEFQRQERRLRDLYPGIVACLGEIDRRFRRRQQEFDALPASEAPEVYIAKIKEVLGVTQDELLTAFGRRKPALGPGGFSCKLDTKRRQRLYLTPLRDYVTYHHDRTLRVLEKGPPPGSGVASAQVADLAGIATYQQFEPGSALAQNTSSGIWKSFGNTLLEQAYRIPLVRAAMATERSRKIELKFHSEETPASIDFLYFHSGRSNSRQKLRDGATRTMRRGLYGWTYDRGGDKVSCQLSAPKVSDNCPLDLIRHPCPNFKCPVAPPDTGCELCGELKELYGGGSCDTCRAP